MADHVGESGHRRRYDACDESCTTDCGHCKGVTFAELVYADQEAIDWFRDTWPQARFEDARDMIHDQRFHVLVPGVSEDEAYPLLIAEGFALVCLGLGIILHQPERKADVERWIEGGKSLIAARQSGSKAARD